MQKERSDKESERERHAPERELRKAKLVAAGDDGGEGKARGLRRKRLPTCAHGVLPFAVDRRHAVQRGDENGAKEQHRGEIAIGIEVGRGPEREGPKTRISGDAKDAGGGEL